MEFILWVDVAYVVYTMGGCGLFSETADGCGLCSDTVGGCGVRFVYSCVFTVVCVCLQWFKEQGVVDRLIDFIHPTVDSMVHVHCAHILVCCVHCAQCVRLM